MPPSQPVTSDPAPAPRGPKMFDAGTLRYLVLQLIADQPRHGYDIIKAIGERAGGGYAPSPGAIYPLMHGLVGQGLVVVSRDGNKKLHSITPEGLALLAANRSYVDAIAARVASGERADDLRQLMHELKAVVVARGLASDADATRLAAIRDILREARRAIQVLP